MAHERVRREQVQVTGSRPIAEQLAQLLVLAGPGRQGVRADSAHARDGLRDERGHLGLVKLAALTRQVLKGGGVHSAERRLGGEHGAQQRRPPREVELGVDRGVLNLAIGEVLGELVEAVSGQALAHLQARGHLAGGGGVAGPAFDEGRQALQVRAHQVRLFGREHGGDGVEVIAHGVRQCRNLTDLRGEDGPRVVAADRAPRVAAFLDANEGTVQVGHMHARAHEVLRLLDEAVALGTAHRNIVVLAPLLGCGCDHHVGGAALEHAGQKDVEYVGDAVEHGELAVPLGERTGGLDAGLAGDGRNMHAQLGQGLGEAVDAQQDVGGLFVGGQDGVAPRGGGGALEGSRSQGLAQQGAGALTLINCDVVEGLFVQAHAGRGRVLTARQVGESAQRIGHAHTEAAVGLVEGGRIRGQCAAHLTQAGTHLVNACLVDDGRGVLHCGPHAHGEGLTCVGIAVDVRHDVGEAQIGQARVGGDRTRRGGRHVQDRPTGGGRVREDGRDDRRVVAVRGDVDEHAASVGGGLDRVLLGGNQVADALFGPRVAVGGVGDRSLGAQVIAGVLVARERADHLRVFEGGNVLGQAGGEGTGRVAEQADLEVVTDLETRQGGAGIAQGGHCL